jgi:zinc dependent phospholipase C
MTMLRWVSTMKTRVYRLVPCLLASFVFISSVPQASQAYSVLTHEAIIDSAWGDSIKPLLLKRFPHATAPELLEARAHAYGGCIIQDMGYYPFGSKFFTELTHYVRSGDFISALIEESTDLNEYAFSLGALAHYAADNNGHAIGTNRAVANDYPKLRARYGDEVTYAEDPTAHLRVEFAFDVVQVARGRYRSEDYHDRIGFKVAKPLLGRAFRKTYGLELTDVFTDFDLAVGTYRRSAGVLIPEATKVAWETKKSEIEAAVPGITREKFVYGLSRENYEREWGHDYDKPGVFDKTMAFLIRIVPKIGPFKVLAFKAPTPAAERMFFASFDATLVSYRGLLNQVSGRRLRLENRDFDTGLPTRAGEYKLADESYGKLARMLADKNLDNLTPQLRDNILAFFRNTDAPVSIKDDPSEWRATLRAVAKLRGSSVATRSGRSTVGQH